MQETILLLRQQLSSLSDASPSGLGTVAYNGAASLDVYSDKLLEKNPGESRIASYGENHADENTPTSVMSLNRVLSLEDSKECNSSTFFISHVYTQVFTSLWALLWENSILLV